MATAVPIRGPKLKHDGPLTVAIGESRESKKWVNTTFTLSAFLGRFAQPVRIKATVAEYQAMTKDRRDDVKDCGGYLKGVTRRGLRRAREVERFQLVALDIDHARATLWEDWQLLYDCASWRHSTCSHTPEQPRSRLLVPLARPVSGDELQAVSRKLAERMGMEQFDTTTFQPERLNYWPSCPTDAEYLWDYQDGPWLDPDEILAEYTDWRDVSAWPTGATEDEVRRKITKAGDPYLKRGVVGAWCRAYSIDEAIAMFLPEVYVPGKSDDRYSYAGGSTTNGARVYEGKWLYSWHDSDPHHEKLMNAFDLVRLHRFGGLDKEAKPGTPVVRLPSYTAMTAAAREDERVKQTIGREAIAAAVDDFGEALNDEDDEWLKSLELDKQGNIAGTRDNILRIMEHDPHLKGAVSLNEFTHQIALRKSVPWRKEPKASWDDSDDAGLMHYLERVYKIDEPRKTTDVLRQLTLRHRFHPVREYLYGLQWDGVPRLETLLVEYLGAEDTRYVRTVTRKAFCAAVARVSKPGCKYDYTLVLVGPQGIGKSLLLQRMARDWFNDSLTTVQGKEACEQLIGSWILEMSELAATRRAERESVKQFLSKTEDVFRVPYARHTSTFPRQCVFFGTTNEEEFLRDDTGNRRFWPVVVTGKTIKKVWKHLSDTEIDQLWAEAVHYWKVGEELYLPADLEPEALETQAEHLEESDKAGQVREFLDIPLPDDWDGRSLSERREYLHGSDFGEAEKGTNQRQRVCAMEVWCELFIGDPKGLTWALAREIHSILRTSRGWEPVGKQRCGSLYGVQRAYARKPQDA